MCGDGIATGDRAYNGLSDCALEDSARFSCSDTFGVHGFLSRMVLFD